jgi:membrane protease YdiL (CAAX protease family)
MEEKMDSETRKKQLLIFFAVAFGITYLMGLLMWYGYANNIDVSAFPNAQMMYPACGVILAYLLIQKDDQKMPKGFYRCFLFITLLLIIESVVSIVLPDELIVVANTSISLWTFLTQILIMVGSLVCWGFYLAAGKIKRSAYGLKWKNWKASLLCITLFLGLYILRTIFSCAISGQINQFVDLVKNPTTWIGIGALPINFFLVFIAFFGEEYGWRYYLQPLLQKQFGIRRGVLLLGVIWGFWHLPVDFFYYSPDAGLVAAVAQQITCITLGIFFAYAYGKTKNIWVPVILHYLNNNLVPIISGNYSSDVLQNQQLTWGMLPMALLVNALFFGLFLFSKSINCQFNEE